MKSPKNVGFGGPMVDTLSLTFIAHKHLWSGHDSGQGLGGAVCSCQLGDVYNVKWQHLVSCHEMWCDVSWCDVRLRLYILLPPFSPLAHEPKMHTQHRPHHQKCAVWWWGRTFSFCQTYLKLGFLEFRTMFLLVVTTVTPIFFCELFRGAFAERQKRHVWSFAKIIPLHQPMLCLGVGALQQQLCPRLAWNWILVICLFDSNSGTWFLVFASRQGGVVRFQDEQVEDWCGGMRLGFWFAATLVGSIARARFQRKLRRQTIRGHKAANRDLPKSAEPEWV